MFWVLSSYFVSRGEARLFPVSLLYVLVAKVLSPDFRSSPDIYSLALSRSIRVSLFMQMTLLSLFLQVNLFLKCLRSILLLSGVRGQN